MLWRLLVCARLGRCPAARRSFGSPILATERGRNVSRTAVVSGPTPRIAISPRRPAVHPGLDSRVSQDRVFEPEYRSLLFAARLNAQARHRILARSRRSMSGRTPSIPNGIIPNPRPLLMGTMTAHDAPQSAPDWYVNNSHHRGTTRTPGSSTSSYPSFLVPHRPLALWHLYAPYTNCHVCGRLQVPAPCPVRQGEDLFRCGAPPVQTSRSAVQGARRLLLHVVLQAAKHYHRS